MLGLGERGGRSRSVWRASGPEQLQDALRAATQLWLNTLETLLLHRVLSALTAEYLIHIIVCMQNYLLII